MNIAGIGTSITRLASRGVLITQKHSPELLTAAGIVGGITAAIMGAKATLQLEPVVDKLQGNLETARANKDLTDAHGKIVHDEKHHARKVGLIYLQGGLDLVKLYGPAVTVGAGSIVCIVSAHGILHRRNVALAAAYTAVEKGFSEYRKRVEAAVGEEKENELRYGITSEDIHDTKAGTVTKKPTLGGGEIYARFFDETSSAWSKSPEQNLLFLKGQQNYFNQKLHARGHVFLNEVYEALGVPISKAGQVVGWVHGHGDSYIDFGIWSKNTEAVRHFVNGYEPAILLDFNVDGNILDLI